jgi:predicted nucleic acid-binding protein
MYVLDTNVFNWLLDGRIALEKLPSDGAYLATHIQMDEIGRTSDPVRRGMLEHKFREIGTQVVPTETAVPDIAVPDLTKVSDGVMFESLRSALDKANRKKNNPEDALIADVAIQNGYTLITADADLAHVAAQHGGKVLRLKHP